MGGKSNLVKGIEPEFGFVTLFRTRSACVTIFALMFEIGFNGPALECDFLLVQVQNSEIIKDCTDLYPLTCTSFSLHKDLPSIRIFLH